MNNSAVLKPSNMANKAGLYAPNVQVRQMEVNRLNNRSVVYIVEDHGTLQDLMVHGSTKNGNTSEFRQTNKLMAKIESKIQQRPSGMNPA